MVDFYFNGFPAASCVVVKISHNIQRVSVPNIKLPKLYGIPLKIQTPKMPAPITPIRASHNPVEVLPI